MGEGKEGVRWAGDGGGSWEGGGGRDELTSKNRVQAVAAYPWLSITVLLARRRVGKPATCSPSYWHSAARLLLPFFPNTDTLLPPPATLLPPSATLLPQY